MVAGLEMMACPNLAVSPEVMQHIVNVESSHNPYAIGVVGGQLVRQPQNLPEAIATVQMLESKGYNYSVGLAQVNRNNLAKYGIDTFEKAFDQCTNLSVGARILADCYNGAGDWGKAFSCYYSGNYVTGYRTGYVQKVFDSIGRAAHQVAMTQAAPIQLISQAQAMEPTPRGNPRATNIAYNVPVTTTGAAYRVAIRSSLIDTAVNSLVSPAVASMAGLPAGSAQAAAVSAAASTNNQAGIPQTTQALAAMMAGQGGQGQAMPAQAAPAGMPQTTQELQAMMQNAQVMARQQQLQQQQQQLQAQQMQNQSLQMQNPQQVQAMLQAMQSQQGSQLSPQLQAQLQAARQANAQAPEAAALAAIEQQEAASQAAADSAIYRPQLNGTMQVDVPGAAGQQQQQAAPAGNVQARPADQADLRQGDSDGAFVF